MAQQLSNTQAVQLAEILEAKAHQADEEGDITERNTLNADAAAFRNWAHSGGPLPPAAARYAYLLNGAEEEASAGPDGLATVAELPGQSPADGWFGPAPVEAEAESEAEAVAAAGEPESAEAYELRRDLARARQRLDSLAAGDVGGLASVRAEVANLLSRHGATPAAEALAAQIADRVNRTIEEARARGDHYRDERGYDDARRQYDVILKLDQDDRRARDAIRAIDQAVVAQEGGETRARLLRDLRERADMEVLERAVRDAEMLSYEDSLAPDLAGLLREARAVFDEKRRQQGEMTTFARFGDLKARQQATRHIMERVMAGDKLIFDAGRNEYVKPGDALREAQSFYREKSEDLANYELNHIKRMLPGHPAAALAHLNQVMETRPPVEGEAGVQYARHFQPEVVTQLLAPRATELELMVDALRRAGDKVTAADQETDELVALRLLLEANGLYPGMIGLKTRLDLARNAAVGRLAGQMEAQHDVAGAALDEERFADAEAALAAADRIPGGWPEPALPAELQALKERSAQLRETIQSNRKRRADFTRLDARIRADLLDPDKRGEALELYNDVIVKYAALEADISDLRSFVNQHKGTGEQLAELRRYIEDEKWQDARQLAGTIQQSGKAGDAADEVKKLLAQATQELAIIAILEHLKARRVWEADKLLKGLHLEEPAQQALKNRLEDASRTIKAAMEEKTMGPLYEEAVKLAKRPEPERQLEALRRLHHVAGDASQTPDAAWPAYALSVYTADASAAAVALRQKLRDDLLPGIREAAGRVRANQAADNDSLVAAAADHARLLRDATLLDTAEEKGHADDLVLFQGRADAAAKEAIGDWDGAVALWERLDRAFKRRVVADLRRARIEQASRAADRHIRAGRPDEAQTTLQLALDDPEIGEAWELYLKQADVYAARGNFDDAANVLRHVEDLLPSADPRRQQVAPIVEKKQQALQREQSIRNAHTKATAERDNSRYKEAMTTVNNALKDPLLGDSRRLKQLRSDIYRRGSEFLLGEAEAARSGASQESKTRAVVRLAELDEIERLADVPPAQRRAADLLGPLKAELAPSIRATLDQAIAFNPSADSLDRSIEQATDLSNRLQTFRQVSAALSVELGHLAGQLEQEGPNISNLVDQLNRLRDLLNAVDDSDPANQAAQRLWDEAIVSGNFERLETQRRQIQATGLDDSPDAIAFQQRLDEWKETRETLYGHIQDIVANFMTGAAFPAREGEPEERAENFGGVLRDVRALRQRPATRRDGRSPWLQLRQDDYARIHELMGPLLVIPDMYEGNHLHGWNDAENAAADRLKEVNAWTTWDYAYTQHMNLAGARAAAAEALPPTATRVQQREAWLQVDAALIEAQAELGKPVQLEGKVVDVRTRWAELISQRAEKARALAAEWRAYVQTRLPDAALLVFPTAADFDRAAKAGPDALAAKLAEAEQIGPSTDEERRRLAHFRDKVLPTLGHTRKGKGLLGWLKGE